VTPLDAEASEVLTMPEDSLYPFLLALSLLATFYGLLTALWPLAIAGAALVAAMTIGWLWPAPPPQERAA
jgi:hypothetical protein